MGVAEHAVGPPPTAFPDAPPWRAARRLLAVAVPGGLIATLYVWVGRLGFQPTDDGNLLAQTWRLLHGEVPHRDVIFARPMGSAALHLVDYALPMPLFESARLIGIAEFVAYSLLFAWLVFDRPPSRWGPARWLAAAASALVSIHTFPLIGWYTTDGLLLVAAGFVLLRTGLRDDRLWMRAVGMLLLGCAPLAKQSFFLAPVLGGVLVATDVRSSGRRLESFIGSGLVAALPLAAYLGILAIAGGLGDFFSQIAGAKTVWGTSFVSAFDAGRAALGLSSVAGSTVALLLVRRTVKNAAIDLAARAGYTAVIVWFLVSGHLAFRGTWALALVWAALLVVLWRAIAERTFDRAGLIVVAAGWMTALSWGYEVPNLIAGACALYLLDRAWRDVDLRGVRALVALGTVVTLAGSSLITAAFAQARYRHPYGDRPAAELTAPLADVSPEFGSIRTNPNTASYLSELARCVRAHPASRTAVLPDNPGIYPALELRNPFPIDWMYFAEIAGHEDRILRATRRLNERGDYLVLFQTFKLTALQETAPLPKATATSRIHGGPLMHEIRARLHGRAVTCGYFVGVYAPG
jgi:hypothetical protein